MEKKRVFFSINTKFIMTLVLAFILPLTLVNSLFVHQLRDVFMQKEQEYVTRQIAFTKEELQRHLQEMESIVTSLLINPAVTGILTAEHPVPSYDWFQEYKSVSGLLSSLSNQSGSIYHISILCTDKSLFTTNPNSSLDLESPLIARILEGGQKPLIVNRKLERLGKQDMITYGRPVFINGVFRGVILVDLLPQTFDRVFETFNWADHKIYIFIDPDHIIYTSDPTLDTSVLPQALHTLLEPGQQEAVFQGETYLTNTVSLPDVEGTILSLLSTTHVFNEINTLFRFFIIGFLLLLVLALGSTTFVSTHISASIVRLKEQVTAFGTETYNLQPADYPPDEVGDLAAGFSAMGTRIEDLLEEVKEKERRKREQEFKMLQAQINPHMVYNTLNTITYLADLQGVENISKVSSSFAALLRLVSNGSSEFITIERELEFITHYIDIKKYNLYWDIKTNITVSPESLGKPILKLILQPLIENAMTHAFNKDIINGCITVGIRSDEKKIYITVTDNGIGIEPALLHKLQTQPLSENSDSFVTIGLSNIIQRLALQYGTDAIFTIESAPRKGTHIHLEYPYNRTSNWEDQP